jgi:hypothetical protein
MTTGNSRPRRRFRLGNSPLDIICDAAVVSLPALVLSAQHTSLDTVIAVVLTVSALVLCERSLQPNYRIANEYGYLRDQILGVIGAVHLSKQRIGCGSHDGLIDVDSVCDPRNPVLDKLKFIAVRP